MTNPWQLQVTLDSKAFGDEEILTSISFAVRAGEIVSLFGPSGIGKSTLLRIISGLETDYSGQVFVNGERIQRPTRNVATVFQDPLLLPWMSVGANIRFALREEESDRFRFGSEDLYELLAFVGLEKRVASLRPSQISGGMAKRVSLARALACDPRVLLLDEPFGALDGPTKHSIQTRLETILTAGQATQPRRMLRELPATILVTHNIEEAVALSDRILMLRDSRPTTVVTEVPVALPRPRHRDHPKFKDVCQEVLRISLERCE